MKKILLLGISIVLSLNIYGQDSFFEKGSTKFNFESPISNIPKDDVSFIDFTHNNIVNHPLDKKGTGSISSNFIKVPQVIIQKKNIARIVFYTQNQNENTDVENVLINNDINGEMSITYYSDNVVKLEEKVDLRNNWVEYHKNIDIYNINKVSITFNSSSLKSKLFVDKIKISQYSEKGADYYKSREDNEKLILSTVNGTNYSEQINAIKNVYDDNILDLFEYREQVIKVKSFGEGVDLGIQKEALINPFKYPSFTLYFNKLKNKADSATKLELENISSEINKGSWLNIVGNIANVITGGTFNSLIESINDIVNEQIITYNNSEIYKLSGKLFTLKSNGGLKPFDDPSGVRAYNDSISKDKDYITFLKRLQILQLSRNENYNQFAKTKNKIDILEENIDLLLNRILQEADLSLIINDAYRNGRLNNIKYYDLFDEKFDATVDDVNILIDKKIKYSLIKNDLNNLKKEYSILMSAVKTHYDNSFTSISFREDLFDKLNTSDGFDKIKEDWKTNVRSLSETYRKSSILKDLKEITKSSKLK
ncbi:hypothetical protein [uncultured Dokdonia sp.]|uniref:hypothetical protein n=1 Tax=uncultured Dokdonia sp. TaxID=575653 RepID=UPI002609C90C|nr:hypothetical protein [uncultured Dokdonia sp.]